jgi:hypothetical protein
MPRHNAQAKNCCNHEEATVSSTSDVTPVPWLPCVFVGLHMCVGCTPQKSWVHDIIEKQPLSTCASAPIHIHPVNGRYRDPGSRSTCKGVTGRRTDGSCEKEHKICPPDIMHDSNAATEQS